LKAIYHCEKELLETLSDKNCCEDPDELKILKKKVLECTQRLSIAFYNYGREIEQKLDFDSAIDSYGKALNVMKDLEAPPEKMMSRISKARALALEKKVQMIGRAKAVPSEFRNQMVSHDELDYQDYRTTPKRNNASTASIKKKVAMTPFGSDGFQGTTQPSKFGFTVKSKTET
jgi:hypothetical protein